MSDFKPSLHVYANLYFTLETGSYALLIWAATIVANMKHASTYSPVAFRSVHTGIEPPFLL